MRKLLFICSRNRIRSLEAERLLSGCEGVAARSRGTERNARIRLQSGDVGWADEIFVMERRHAERVKAKFGEFLEGKRISVLRIRDIYALGEPRLREILRSRLSEHDLELG